MTQPPSPLDRTAAKAKYGPWAVIAGASDGTGEGFAPDGPVCRERLGDHPFATSPRHCHRDRNSSTCGARVGQLVKIVTPTSPACWRAD